MTAKAPIILLIAVLGLIFYLVIVSAPGSFSPVYSDNIVLVDADINLINERVQESAAQVKLLNVWATWCGPCVEEFPYLLQLREHFSEDEFDLIFVSADIHSQRSKVLEFLEDQGVDFKTYLKTGDDMDFINGLNPEWSGALPATGIYDRDGVLQRFWIGEASFEEFKERVQKVLSGH